MVSGEHWFAPYRGYVAGVSPQEQWDACPPSAAQILVAIGMLESCGEGAGNGGPRALLQQFVVASFFCTSTARRWCRGDGCWVPPVAATPSTRRLRRRRRRAAAAAVAHPIFLASDLGYFRRSPDAPAGQVGFNLYDPFNWFDSAYPAGQGGLGVLLELQLVVAHTMSIAALAPSNRVVSSQARRRRVEINNGRAAMLGIFMMSDRPSRAPSRP